jgi:hypothetical protein
MDADGGDSDPTSYEDLEDRLGGRADTTDAKKKTQEEKEEEEASGGAAGGEVGAKADEAVAGDANAVSKAEFMTFADIFITNVQILGVISAVNFDVGQWQKYFQWLQLGSFGLGIVWELDDSATLSWLIFIAQLCVQPLLLLVFHGGSLFVLGELAAARGCCEWEDDWEHLALKGQEKKKELGEKNMRLYGKPMHWEKGTSLTVLQNGSNGTDEDILVPRNAEKEQHVLYKKFFVEGWYRLVCCVVVTWAVLLSVLLGIAYLLSASDKIAADVLVAVAILLSAILMLWFTWTWVSRFLYKKDAQTFGEKHAWLKIRKHTCHTSLFLYKAWYIVNISVLAANLNAANLNTNAPTAKMIVSAVLLPFFLLGPLAYMWQKLHRVTDKLPNELDKGKTGLEEYKKFMLVDFEDHFLAKMDARFAPANYEGYKDYHPKTKESATLQFGATQVAYGSMVAPFEHSFLGYQIWLLAERGVLALLVGVLQQTPTVMGDVEIGRNLSFMNSTISNMTSSGAISNFTVLESNHEALQVCALYPSVCSLALTLFLCTAGQSALPGCDNMLGDSRAYTECQTLTLYCPC